MYLQFYGSLSTLVSPQRRKLFFIHVLCKLCGLCTCYNMLTCVLILQTIVLSTVSLYNTSNYPASRGHGDNCIHVMAWMFMAHMFVFYLCLPFVCLWVLLCTVCEGHRRYELVCLSNELISLHMQLVIPSNCLAFGLWVIAQQLRRIAVVSSLTFWDPICITKLQSEKMTIHFMLSPRHSPTSTHAQTK